MASDLDINLRGQTGEDGITLLDIGERLHAPSMQLFLRLVVLVDRQQGSQLLQVRDEALFGVVARSPGSDQELPVARFQQQQFAADLLHQALGKAVRPPQPALYNLLHSELRWIDVLPRPFGVVVQPDFVGAVLAPRTFRKRKKSRGRKLIEVLARGREFDLRAWMRKLQRQTLQKLRTFKPPVSEKLRIEGRA